MTLGGHFFLLGQDFLAHTAVLSFGQAGLSAGCYNGSIHHRSVTLGGHFFLLGQDFAANAAVAACGQAGLGAGGCNGCIRYHGVLRDRNNFLCLQHCITYAAVAACGQAGLGAGRCNGCIRYPLVTRGGIIRIFYFFFTIELLSAQQNCDRIYIFSDLRTGCIDAVPICSAICFSGNHFLAVLASRRNRY